MAVSGIRAPYIRLFYNSEEVTIKVKRFRYVYAEAEDDICEIDVESGDRDMADTPMFQTYSEFSITWGYMGEPNTIKSRKIFLQDDRWEYGETGVKGFLIFTDKARSLAFENAPEVYNNKTLPEIAKDMADRKGLKVKVGVMKHDAEETRRTNMYLAAGNGETNLASVVIDIKEEAKKNALKQVFVDFDTWDKSYNKVKRGWKYDSQNDPSENITKDTELPNNFNVYKSIPSGQISNKLFLQKLAAREKGGNTIIDTRDDEVIIRKRNFAQAPYRGYVFMGEGNEIIEFTPEYKNRKKAGSADNIGFTGWNKENKEFYTGNTNSMMDNTTDALGNIQSMAAYLRNLPKNQQAGTFELDPLNGSIRYNKNKTKVLYANPGALTGQGAAVQSFSDNTNNFKDIKIPITVGEDLKALDAAIANQQTSGKTAYDPTSNNPFDAFNNAANLRNNAELNRNPATLKVEGDTGITVGIVITIMGAAKKHMGNYYVIKSEHNIEADYYATDLDLVRDGSNFAYKGGVDVTKFGKQHNTKKGAIHPKSNTRKVGSKKQ